MKHLGDITKLSGFAIPPVDVVTGGSPYQNLSIALPFWRWMLARIMAYCDHSATLGSLFDGIGGFPLCWQQVGGVPAWASEIEEVPIAVTRKHFGEE